MAIKSLSIRIDEKMLDKLHVVADYEGRSANSGIFIRDAIEAYEAKHDGIEIEKFKERRVYLRFLFYKKKTASEEAVSI